MKMQVNQNITPCLSPLEQDLLYPLDRIHPPLHIDYREINIRLGEVKTIENIIELSEILNPAEKAAKFLICVNYTSPQYNYAAQEVFNYSTRLDFLITDYLLTLLKKFEELKNYTVGWQLSEGYEEIDKTRIQLEVNVNDAKKLKKVGQERNLNLDFSKFESYDICEINSLNKIYNILLHEYNQIKDYDKMQEFSNRLRRKKPDLIKKAKKVKYWEFATRIEGLVHDKIQDPRSYSIISKPFYSFLGFMRDLEYPNNFATIQTILEGCHGEDTWEKRFAKFQTKFSDITISTSSETEYLEKVAHGLSRAITDPAPKFDISGAELAYTTITKKLAA